MEYEFIQSDDELIKLRINFYENKITKLAMDFEADYDRHYHGTKLCLIQLFDNNKFYLIDPFRVSSEELIKFFENKKIVKYMYGAGGDMKLAYDKLKIKVQSVYDIQFLVDVLGISPKGLDKVLNSVLNIESIFDKEYYQLYDWATRPLPNDAIEYALSDVKYLIKLHDKLWDEINKKQLVYKLIEKIIKADYDFNLKGGEPSLFRKEEFKSLSNDNKDIFRRIYNVRDNIAKKYDFPTQTVLSNSDLFRITDDFSVIYKIRFTRKITEEIRNEIIEQILEKAMHCT